MDKRLEALSSALRLETARLTGKMFELSKTVMQQSEIVDKLLDRTEEVLGESFENETNKSNGDTGGGLGPGTVIKIPEPEQVTSVKDVAGTPPSDVV